MVLFGLDEWALTAVAGVILKNFQNQINPKEGAQVLKQAMLNAQEQVSDLFAACQPDGYQGIRSFLEHYFQEREVVTQLQKPFQAKGKPSVDVLVEALQQQAQAHERIERKYKKDFLKLWVEAFVESYFNQVQGILFKVKRTEYLQCLSSRLDDIKFVGIAVAGEEIEKQEALASIFVMPTVLEEQRSISAPTAVEIDPDTLSDSDPQQQLLAEQRRWAKRDQSGRKLPAQQVLGQSQNKAVFLGAPGSGKSTLVSFFALMLADHNASDATQIGFDPDQDWLPLVVQIRNWAWQPQLGLLAYLRWFATESLAVELPTGFFEYWLDRGRALILLDGLDEVVKEDQRRTIVEQIETFWGRYSHNPGIITSRPAGYRWDFFDFKTFPHYTLEPFDKQQIQTFIDHWYTSREPDPTTAERRKVDLAKAFQDNDRIQLLAKNPLLLTIIVLIHRYQAVLPRQRFKLYEKAVETLLTTWDSARDIRLYAVLTFLKPDDLLYILKKLAYWIHTQGNTGDTEGGTLIDKEELVRQLCQQIRGLKNCPSHEAKCEAERFVEFIKQRTGLLNEQGRDCYAFVHKTFQEYLTAEEIYDQFEEGDDDIISQHLQDHLHEQHWREVLLLLVSRLKRKRAAKAIRGIYEADSEYEQWLHRDLLFAGWCLTEDPQGITNANQKLVDDILDGLVQLEISDSGRIGSVVKNEADTILHRLGETAIEEQAWAKLNDQSENIDRFRLLSFQASLGQEAAVTETLLTLLKDPESNVRGSAVGVLWQLGNSSSEIVTGLLALLKDPESNVCGNAVEVLVTLGNSSSEIMTGLLALLKDSESNVCGSAAKVLGHLDNSSSEIVTGLLALLKDPEPNVRIHAAVALGSLGNNSSEIMTGLLALLKDPESNVRGNAAVALGNLGDSSGEITTGLLALLKDPESNVRGNAAVALGNLGDSSSKIMTGLLALLKDPESNVRIRAVMALVKLGNNSSEITTGLLTLLKDPEWFVRIQAIEALVKLGTNNADVALTLVTWISQQSEEVRLGDAVNVLSQLCTQ